MIYLNQIRSNLIVNNLKVQLFIKMYSKITKPLEGKVAIITASTDG